MSRARSFASPARVGFFLVTAALLYPFARLFDRIADALYRPRDVKSVADCVVKVCRIAETYYTGPRRSWASLIRRSGYRRLQDKVTLEMLRDEFRRHPSLCASWQGYSEDIRYSPAWYVNLRTDAGRFLAGYYHNDPAKRTECVYDTQEDACAHFLVGFLQTF